MKTFKQYISEIGANTVLDMLQKTKMSNPEKKELAKMTAKEVGDTLVKKYQLPTKVI
tara:strand:+ start:1898 stop:2068 length:171 start_codon:yes stop_codon:yes gene_type:complete